MTIVHNVPYNWSPATGLWTAPGRGSLLGPSGPSAPATKLRSDLVYGTYVPGLTVIPGYDNGTVGLSDPAATFTDVYPGTTVDGYIYIDSIATVGASAANPIRNMRYWGKVKPRVTGNVYFENCDFLNRKPEDMYANNVSANGGCVENFGSNPPHLTFTDCRMYPKYWFDKGLSAYWGHPIQVGCHGGNYTGIRSEWRGCQDGHNYVGPNSASAAASAFCYLRGCWVHANFYLNAWTGPGSPASQDTHSDAFQWNTGSNFDLQYNYFGGHQDPAGYALNPGGYNSGDDCHNSANIIQQEQDSTATAHVGNVVCSNNWMAAGAATINANYKNGNLGADWKFENNKMARRGTGQFAGAGYYIYRHGSLQTQFNNNTIWDPLTGSMDGTGVAVPIVNYTGT